MNTAVTAALQADLEPVGADAAPRRRRSRSRPETPKAPALRPLPKLRAVTTATRGLDDTVPPRKAAASAQPLRGDLLLYAVLAVLIGSAWQISRLGWIDRDHDLNYWIGVTGGSMLLLLFIYPLRKHVGAMRGLGKVKWFFWFHMCMGIAGSWLILVHSGFFRIGSLNAAVALYTLCIVVCSGVVGRFIYVRIYRGLSGERTSLQALRQRAGLIESNARSRLSFAPKVERLLLAFERHELEAGSGWLTHLRQVTWLPAWQWITYLRCVFELRAPLRRLARHYGWNASDLNKRRRRARRLVDQYLDAVVRVAQYTAFERVFALWHMAHLPFIYLLVISVAVHVFAVHAY